MKKFNVFDPILIRTSSTTPWFANFYNHFDDTNKRHWCITGTPIKDENILPYNEETSYLHNTVGEFVKWEPKRGEPILVKDFGDKTWSLRIFLEMRNDYYICTSEHGATDSPFVWEQAKPYVNPFKE